MNAQPQPSRTPRPTPTDPHAGQPLLVAGPAPQDAAATLILVHGRGASAEDMLSLFDVLHTEGVAALAPQAAGHTWYPQSFLAPLDLNQPYLDSALRRIDSVIEDLLSQAIPPEKIALLGFSQGACLVTEYAARHPRRYGAVMGLTGGLIGPPGTPRNYPGSLPATPVFLSSGDPDPHIPFQRMRETAAVFERMGAAVELRRYPGRPHTIIAEELQACRDLLVRLSGRRSQPAG